MRLLLDTHTLLWWLFDDPQLSAKARALIADPGNTVLVSTASAWEVAIKHRIGKLPEAGEAVRRFASLIREARMEALPIGIEHALQAGSFSTAHRDPFDRMLVSQAIVHGLTILTPDSLVTQYPGRTTW